MNKTKQTNINSLANLKPIRKGEIRNTQGTGGRKKGLESLIRDALSRDDLKEIVQKVAEEAKNGNIKAAEFVFDRLYGKPAVMIDLSDSQQPTFIQNNFNIEVQGKSMQELQKLYIELESTTESDDDS